MAFELAGAEVPAGSTEWIEVPIATDTDMRDLTVQIYVVNGADDGSTLWAQGTIHGVEQTPGLALRDFLLDLDPADVSGTIVGIPVINPWGFTEKTRVVPVDGKDPNRSFPGSKTGSFTDVWADKMFTIATDVADYFVGFHGGGTETVIPGFSMVVETDDDTEEVSMELAKAADMPHITNLPYGRFAGGLWEELANGGTPAILVECDGKGEINPEFYDNVTRGLNNIADHIGLLDGEQNRQNTPEVHTQLDFPSCRTGGYFHAEIDGHEYFEEGQQLGHITDIKGRTVETIEADYNGVVIGVRSYATVRPGDTVFELAPSE